jgi:hypothetical protein
MMKAHSVRRAAALLGCIAVSQSMVFAQAPQYQIFDIGVVQAGDTAAQGLGVSPGGVAVGRSLRSGASQAFSWTGSGGIVGLPNLAGRSFCVSNGANDNGVVVGSGSTTTFGSNRLPVIWQNGVASQLPLPGGQTTGDANKVNAAGVIVGSVNGGSLQRGAIYQGGGASVITQTTPGGSFFVTAFGINNSGRVVGQGIDPNDAARNVGIVYDIGSSAAYEVGALPDHNGALSFGVSNAGHVVGASMMNQGSGLPFIWSQKGGIAPIPLPTGTSQGSARGVNSAGWAVGTASSAFAIPFVYDGQQTYRLADLIPSNSGWNLSTNTSSSALGISDNGVIVGTGVLNGQTRAYAMVPVPNAPVPTAATSVKMHASAEHGINLPLTGTPGIECRSPGASGSYRVVVTFPTTVTLSGASVTAGSGSVAQATANGTVVTVDLANVTDAQTLTVRLAEVSNGSSTGNVDVRMSVLIGDANGDGTVNTGDALQTRNRSGQPTDGTNFRSDFNADGFVNSGDVLIVRGRSGNSVP